MWLAYGGLMSNLIGTAPDQVPVNGMLGTLAFQDAESVNIATITVSKLINAPKYTTALAPAYVKGAIWFDTTLNKLKVGGATAWETITSV